MTNLQEGKEIKRDGVRQLVSCVTIFLPVLSGGMAAGWTSPTEEYLTQLGNQTNPELTMNQFSWMNSVLFFGGFFACLCWTPITDKFGRKKAGYLLGLIQLMAWTGFIVTRNYAILLVCRFALGLTFIGGLIVGVTYTNEITSDSLKGPLCSFSALFINLGFLSVFVCGYVFTYDVLNLICAFVPVVYLLLLLRVPESPIYLMMDENARKAQKSLMWYRGNKMHKVHRDMVTIRASKDHQTKAKLWDVISNKDVRGTIVIGTIVMLGQQLSGITVMCGYTVRIFRKTGSSFSPHISMILMGVLQVTGCALAGTIINRVSQKYLLIASYVLCALSFLLLSASFYLQEIGYKSSVLNWLPLISALSYIFMFTIGIGSVPFILFTWMFTPNVLSTAMSIAQIVGNIGAFCTAKVFPFAMEYFGGSGAFLILAACNLFMGVYVLRYIENKKSSVLQSNGLDIN